MNKYLLYGIQINANQYEFVPNVFMEVKNE